VKQELRTSLDGEATALAGYDPLGFLDLPVLANLRESSFDFASEDGRLWLVMVPREDLSSDYKEQAAWVSKVRSALPDWSEDDFHFQLTGGPVYGAEIGVAMERDMSGTITITAILVGLLFLIVQRDLRQLLALAVILAMVFVVTLGLGGWIYGTLNLVSAGFAAILLGLVIDYAVVLAREAGGGKSSSELRRELAPAVGWAAATTAAVFGVLALSSFPGVRQLGGLIVIGLLAGALLMLFLMPLVLERLSPRPARSWKQPIFLKVFPSALLMGVPLVIALVFFGVCGLPPVSFDSEVAQPKNSEAANAFEKIQARFPAWSEENWQVVAAADTANKLSEKAAVVSGQLAALREKGMIASYQWPQELIPDPLAYERNQTAWQEVAASKEKILSALTEIGFSEQGRTFSRQVLSALPAPLEFEDPFVSLFIKRDSGGREVFAGRLLLIEDSAEGVLKVFSGEGGAAATVTGWDVLQRVTLPLVRNDFQKLFIPAAVVLILALLAVFRSWRDALLPAFVMVVALALVNLLLSVTGEGWNFLNSMAIPLIVGTGIDYGIHLIYALRRNRGNFATVWNGVGKAICFCGLSSAIGFGSLMFASNEVLASMGRLCSVGVLLTMSLSLLTIPALWCRFGSMGGGKN
jgi:predicted exporter